MVVPPLGVHTWQHLLHLGQDTASRGRGRIVVEAALAAKAVGGSRSRPPRCVLGFALLVSALAVHAAHADDTFRDCAECPPMVRIPAGTFTMGEPEAGPRSLDDVRPQRMCRFRPSPRVARTLCSCVFTSLTSGARRSPSDE